MAQMAGEYPASNGYDAGQVTDVTIGYSDGITEATADVEWNPELRNRHIRAVCDGIGRINRSAKDGSSPQRIAKTNRLEGRTSRILEKACGACGLSSSCELADNLGAWREVHPYADRGWQGIESRDSLLARIKIDPFAPCEPPK